MPPGNIFNLEITSYQIYNSVSLLSSFLLLYSCITRTLTQYADRQYEYEIPPLHHLPVRNRVTVYSWISYTKYYDFRVLYNSLRNSSPLLRSPFITAENSDIHILMVITHQQHLCLFITLSVMQRIIITKTPTLKKCIVNQ